MILTKKTTVGGQWVKKGEDIKNGDKVKVLNDGSVVTGEYGERQVFKIETRNGERNATFNQTSVNACVDAFGEDTSKWVGKEVKATIVKQNVAGKFIDVVYFSHPDWEMGEYGFTNPDADKTGDIQSEDLPF